MPESNEQLLRRIEKLENELKQFKQQYAIHQHANTDGTNRLRKNIVLDQDQTYTVGSAKFGSSQGYNATNGRNFYGLFATGSQMQETTTNQFPNMQLVMRHLEDDNGLSHLYSDAKPVVVSFENTSISTTIGGNTVTIAGYDFATNSLAGAYINIYDSSGVIQDWQEIASNTATVITIVNTWITSVTGGFFEIYMPVGLGSYLRVWKQLYVDKDDSGGIRFGGNLFANGQQGALYMDTTAGSGLYYTDPFAVTWKLSMFESSVVPWSGTETFFVATSSGGAVTQEITFTDGILTNVA